MKRQLSFLLAFVLCGCLVPTEPADPSKPPPVPPGQLSEIAKLTFIASQQRDLVGAKLLNELADEIKHKAQNGDSLHDKWVMDRITECNSKAASQVGHDLQTALAAELNPGGRLDAGRAEKAVRDMAKGKERAGK